jgi:hypothetical protein
MACRYLRAFSVAQKGYFTWAGQVSKHNIIAYLILTYSRQLVVIFNPTAFHKAKKASKPFSAHTTSVRSKSQRLGSHSYSLRILVWRNRTLVSRQLSIQRLLLQTTSLRLSIRQSSPHLTANLPLRVRAARPMEICRVVRCRGWLCRASCFWLGLCRVHGVWVGEVK